MADFSALPRAPGEWRSEVEACFIIKDNAGQKLAFVYYEEEPSRRSAAKLLTKDEARRIAASMAKLLLERRHLMSALPPKADIQ